MVCPRKEDQVSVRAVAMTEPFPIFLLANRYLLYDINIITYVRREHHICGVLIGSLPQFPQQNIFLGVPLQLTPEEARLLVDKGAAFIIDDVVAHANGLAGLSKQDKAGFMMALDQEGKEVTRGVQKRAEQRLERALEKVREKNGDSKTKTEKPGYHAEDRKEDAGGLEEEAADGSLFAQPTASLSVDRPSSCAGTESPAYHINPTTSYPPLNTPLKPSSSTVSDVPTSYPLFAYLHGKNYFISPGLRFGCQYLVYPGDPLRFHSHFLAISAEWEEELDLLDIVGGGRLGTGVKKGFLIGGVEKKDKAGKTEENVEEGSQGVRTFCIEWGGM